jgi:hypothetical protein
MYFNMAPDTRVVHLMGEPDETRHILVANEQAVVSPSWSIHSGAGTAAYSFGEAAHEQDLKRLQAQGGLLSGSPEDGLKTYWLCLAHAQFQWCALQ